MRGRITDWALMAPAILAGLSIAWMDARPHWDDTGITAGCLFLSAALLGLAGPRWPWLLGLAIGVWIPLRMVLHAPSAGNVLGGLVIVAIPTVGAYAGKLVRRMMMAAA